MQNKYEILIIALAIIILAVFLIGIIKDAKDSLHQLYDDRKPEAKKKKVLHNH
jgi:hypothetical protein